MAIQDMADNANVFGTDIELIQNAYQGFAKNNFTMLDNLKLGYAGTQEGMKQLLADAEKLTGKKFDINNLNDIYEAIHAIQEEMKITGTTSAEAADTLEGSINSMKGAWDNWLTALGTGKGVEQATQNLLDSITTVIENAAPVVWEAIQSVVEAGIDALQDKFDEASEKISNFVNENKDIIYTLAGAFGILAAALVAYNGAAILAAASSAAETLALIGLYTAEAIATGATTAFGAALAFATSPITLITIGIGLLIAAIVLLVKNWDTVKKVLKKGIKAVVNSEPVQKAKELIEKLKEKFEDAVKKFKKNPIKFLLNLTPLGKAIAKLIDTDKLWRNLKKAASKAARFLVKIPGVQTAIDAFKSLKSWWDKIKGNHSATFTTKRQDAGGGKNPAKHRIGIREIPYDDYNAILHKGEAILTAAEVNQYKKFFETPTPQTVNYPSEITVISQIDGRTVAKTTAPFMKEEIDKNTKRTNRKRGK